MQINPVLSAALPDILEDMDVKCSEDIDIDNDEVWNEVLLEPLSVFEEGHDRLNEGITDVTGHFQWLLICRSPAI